MSFSEFLSAQTISIVPVDSSKNVMESVKDYSGKDNFFSKQLKKIFVQDEQLSGNKIQDADKKLIRKCSGKIIRKINVEVLDVFGASLYNPQDTVRTWLEGKGNSLHMKTKEWLIKNKLIFSEGQKLIPFDLQESERIIRQTAYVYDVRIIPQVIKNNPDSVDIIVYSQDLWSTNGSLKYHPGGKTGNISVDDINFLGFGNDLKGGLKIDNRFSHGWDWDGRYSIDNIEKTFLSASLYYSSDLYQQQYGATIGRDFFSPVISWAGAVAQNWQITRYPVVKDSTLFFETSKFNQQDYWLGYAFDLKPFDPNSVYQNRFNIAGRITRTVYSQIPPFDTMNLFQDNTFYLGQIGFSYRTYYQDRFILGLGKTEDIPLINIIELLFGYEKGASNNLPYYGLKTGESFYDDDYGYLYGGFQIGAFRKDERWLKRNVILEMLYFSKLIPIGNFNWRHYVGGRFSLSDNQFGSQVLDINNTDGIRGFSDDILKGNKKLILNYEADIFVPLKVVGFNLAFITFADFGMISSTNNTLFDSKLYQGYGVGFRIKNEQLIFPQFQFLIGIYPNLPQQGGSHFNLFSQSSIFNRLNPFQFSIPSIVTAN
ncbi:MAG: hypothetical protein P4L27_02595 [Ignavibacteriaceae bacterium]|nr:hypothetical protein [Ignavibacteriaceae bacterium]